MDALQYLNAPFSLEASGRLSLNRNFYFLVELKVKLFSTKALEIATYFVSCK